MKNGPSAAVADRRVIPAEITITSANWAMNSRNHHCETVVSSCTLVPTRYATAADSSRPTNIQPNAPTSSCWTRGGAGRTPSCEGVAELYGVPLIWGLLLLRMRGCRCQGL